jgi:hypothetical protein
MYLQLSPRSEETVTPDPSADIGNTTDGLVLDNTNSPPKVAIDGGGRTIKLPPGTPGSLITVENGVTLTLRNIALIGHNSGVAPIVKEDGGRVIYETGVSIYDSGFDGPFSGFTMKPDSAIDLIRLAGASMPGTGFLNLTLSPGTEVVNLNGTSDLGAGLVLDSTNSPAEVTINGGGLGREVRLDAGSANGSVITVRAGVTLKLKNITLAGKDNNDAPLIRVDGGTLILEDGARITGNARTNGTAPDITEEYNESAHGGGGGILVCNGGSLTMTGNSEISGNTAGTIGGGVLVYTANGNGTKSSLTMNGSSTISGNTGKGGGGGLFLSRGTLSMSVDARITGNKDESGGYFYYGGGGVIAVLTSDITMTGNSGISNNNSNYRGGGMHLGGSSLVMTGNSEISHNNSDDWCGGVYIQSGSVAMSQSAWIKENTAKEGAGGVGSLDNAAFTMNGGFISSNTSGGDSGGVDAWNMVFTMTGGAIYGNTAAGNGGGVNVNGSAAVFTMTGGTIYGSSAGAPLANTAAAGAAVYFDGSGSSSVNTTDKTVVNGVETN